MHYNMRKYILAIYQINWRVWTIKIGQVAAISKRFPENPRSCCMIRVKQISQLLFSSPGLSPDLQSMEQIRRVMRPTDVPDQGLLCDLLWADPDKDVLGWGENDRGVSFTFGADVVAKFLHKHDMDLICRAHQVMCLRWRWCHAI